MKTNSFKQPTRQDSRGWAREQTRRIMIYKQGSTEMTQNSQSGGLMSPISNCTTPTNKQSRNFRPDALGHQNFKKTAGLAIQFEMEGTLAFRSTNATLVGNNK